MEILTNAVTLTLLSVGGFLVAYWAYGRFLARHLFRLDPDQPTPAHLQQDDMDFVPTRRSVLFGHHFTSIAGAAPIVGPAVGVFWGWLPALLWVVLGTIFIGAVHDLGCLVISVRNRGRSIADLTSAVISRRARLLFMILVAALIWIVIGVFAVIIASLFVDHPASVIPINFQILVALGIGVILHRRQASLLLPSLLALAALYAVVVWGAYHPVPTYDLPFLLDAPTRKAIHQACESGEVSSSLEEASRRAATATTWEERTRIHDAARPMDMVQYFTGKARASGDTRYGEYVEAIREARRQAVLLWVLLLLGYAFVASMLPVWLLLQPRDFINSHQLLVALALLYLGMLLIHPGMGDAAAGGVPALNLEPSYVNEEGVRVDDLSAPAWFPFLFVVIACGAMSGFHAIVASGTTSKQLDRMSDACPIGYGGMVAEGVLALMSILACTAGIAHLGSWSGAGGLYNRPWSSFGLAARIDSFIQGGGGFLGALGLPAAIGTTILAVLIVAFAATTLDTATRVQRYIFQELGQARLLRPLRGRWLAGALAAFTPFLLVLGGYWQRLWPIFGATNQLLGALALVVLTVYLYRKGRNGLYTLLPMLFLVGVTVYALFVQLVGFISPGEGKPPLVLLATVTVGLLGLALWILLEGLLAYLRGRHATTPLELE